MRKWIMALCCALFALALSSCGPDTKTIRRMQALEEGVSNPTTIEELTEAIAKYRNRIEDILNADIRIGMWYKILAIRYLDNGMYGKALENFRTAIEYYPTNQNLYYYVGVCAGYMAKSALDFEAAGNRDERDRYYRLAESAYLRAIELEGGYARPLYGLGVLYVFELNEPVRAIPHLEKLLTIDTGNIEAMFVLARAYYSNADYDLSVNLYDRIIASVKDETRKKEAEENKALVLAEAYGQK